jgi:hypothetical protein
VTKKPICGARLAMEVQAAASASTVSAATLFKDAFIDVPPD